MKLMFISDIHGISTNLKKIKEKFEELKCDKLVVLGDLYYIGPRNKMIEGYNISEVQEFLESMKDKLLSIFISKMDVLIYIPDVCFSA